MSVEELQKKIAHLERELEIARRGQTQASYSQYIQKIEVLSKELGDRNDEVRQLKRNIEDLQRNSSVSDMQTKVIVLQSKIRQKDIKIRDLSAEVESLKKKNLALKNIVETEGNVEDIKKENAQLKEQVSRLQQQVITLDAKTSAVGALQARVAELEEQLKSRPSPVPSAVASGSDTQILRELALRDQRIQELETQLNAARTEDSAGGGEGFMGGRRYQMRIRELESQLDMLKRSEADMRKRYSEAMRRLAEKEEFNW
ncbi:MAG: hypothetical protein ACTSU5_06515 [Promethearchaeota archaeon]